MAKTDDIVWQCLTCEGQPTFDHEKFIEHAQQVHGIDRKAKGKREMTMHIDGRDYFSSVFKWTINDLPFIQTINSIRSKDDIMRVV